MCCLWKTQCGTQHHIPIQNQFTNEIYPFWKKATVLMFYFFLFLKSGNYSLRKDKYLSFLDLALAPVPCSLWVFPGLGAFGHVLGVSFPVVIWSSAQCKYWARTQTLHRSNTSQQNTIWSICFATEAEGIDDGGKRLKRLAAVRLHSKLTQHYQVVLKTPPQQVVVVNLLYG